MGEGHHYWQVCIVRYVCDHGGVLHASECRWDMKCVPTMNSPVSVAENTSVRKLLALVCLFLMFCRPGMACDRTEADALELGHKVAAIYEALQDPEAADALQAITELGHDQRYYVMVRGWLMYQLQGDLSIVEASQEPPAETVRARIDLIQRAIRAIDLE